MDKEAKEALSAIGEADPQVAGLVAHIMLASSEDNRHVLQQLVESYCRETFELRATLSIIRRRIEYLLEGPYMPTSTALLMQLYPSDAEIKALAATLRKEQGA